MLSDIVQLAWCSARTMFCISMLAVVVSCQDSSESINTQVVMTKPNIEPDQFTLDVTEALASAFPSMSIEESSELRIVLRESDSDTRHHIALGNHFDELSNNPGAYDAVISQVVQTARDAIQQEISEFDLDRLVPIVRSRQWWEDALQEIGERGDPAVMREQVDWLNDELVILYAIDNDSSVTYLKPDDVAGLGLDPVARKKLAIENLNRKIPSFEISGDDNLIMISVGGFYETSAILLDDLWSAQNITVPGECVFAIPQRDLLIITGSEDQVGLGRLRGVVEEFYTGEGRSISPFLFVVREGRIVRFNPDAP